VFWNTRANLAVQRSAAYALLLARVCLLRRRLGYNGTLLRGGDIDCLGKGTTPRGAANSVTERLAARTLPRMLHGGHHAHNLALVLHRVGSATLVRLVVAHGTRYWKGWELTPASRPWQWSQRLQ
jgi:hypothetical protein